MTRKIKVVGFDNVTRLKLCSMCRARTNDVYPVDNTVTGADKVIERMLCLHCIDIVVTMLAGKGQLERVAIQMTNDVLNEDSEYRT